MSFFRTFSGTRFFLRDKICTDIFANFDFFAFGKFLRCKIAHFVHDLHLQKLHVCTWKICTNFANVQKMFLHMCKFANCACKMWKCANLQKFRAQNFKSAAQIFSKCEMQNLQFAQICAQKRQISAICDSICTIFLCILSFLKRWKARRKSGTFPGAPGAVFVWQILNAYSATFAKTVGQITFSQIRTFSGNWRFFKISCRKKTCSAQIVCTFSEIWQTVQNANCKLQKPQKIWRTKCANVHSANLHIFKCAKSLHKLCTKCANLQANFQNFFLKHATFEILQISCTLFCAQICKSACKNRRAQNAQICFSKCRNSENANPLCKICPSANFWRVFKIKKATCSWVYTRVI